MAKKWIKGAIKHPGALHRQLGVPQGEKIPAKKMAAARAGKYGPKAEKRAHLAKTLGSFEHGGMVPKDGMYKLHEGESVVPNSVAAEQHHEDAKGWDGRDYDMSTPTMMHHGKKIAKSMKAKIRMD